MTGCGTIHCFVTARAPPAGRPWPTSGRFRSKTAQIENGPDRKWPRSKATKCRPPPTRATIAAPGQNSPKRPCDASPSEQPTSCSGEPTPRFPRRSRLQIKQTLNLDHVRCKSPSMVRKELWTTLLAYNLVRAMSANAARLHKKRPRQLSFTGACQAVLSAWMLLSTGACRDATLLGRTMLDQIASCEVADRPGRLEPRVLKRRRHRYPLMQRPRNELREELQNANNPP